MKPKEKEMITLELVIHRMFNSINNPNNPAYKAHATRVLTAYARQRAAEIGSTPKKVMAGVRAAVSKRRFPKCFRE